MAILGVLIGFGGLVSTVFGESEFALESPSHSIESLTHPVPGSFLLGTPLSTPNPAYQLVQAAGGNQSILVSRQFESYCDQNREHFMRSENRQFVFGLTGSIFFYSAGIAHLIQNSVIIEEELGTDTFKTLGIWEIMWGSFLMPSVVSNLIWRNRIRLVQQTSNSSGFDLGVRFQRQINLWKALKKTGAIFSGLFVTAAMALRIVSSVVNTERYYDDYTYEEVYLNNPPAKLVNASTACFVFSLIFFAEATFAQFMYHKNHYILFSPRYQMVKTEDQPSLRLHILPTPRGAYGLVTARF